MYTRIHQRLWQNTSLGVKSSVFVPNIRQKLEKKTRLCATIFVSCIYLRAGMHSSLTLMGNGILKPPCATWMWSWR